MAPEESEGGRMERLAQGRTPWRTDALAIATHRRGRASASTRGKSRSKVGAKDVRGDAKVRPVDIHAHYFPQAYLDVIAEEGKRFQVEYRVTQQGFYIQTAARTQGPLPSKIVNLHERIAAMDKQGIAVQAMSLTGPMAHWGDADVSHKLASAWNDSASAAHREYPDRLVGLLTLPMLFPDRAVDELNRACQLPGMRGVYMGTNIDQHDLDDPLFEPVFARIETLGLPVFLHPLQAIGGQRTKAFYLSNLLSFPVDTAIAACHLIFGGVLDRHPKLQICLPHGGGVLPILTGRIDHGWRVRPELQNLGLKKAPSEYLRRFTYDTIVHSKSIMEFVIGEVGADRIMIGSDYCLDMGYGRPVQFLEKIDVTRAERNRMLGENAARILKL
ncbi:MAG: amidohydrolase family protein [Candidatus Acidiferrales bacterium]